MDRVFGRDTRIAQQINLAFGLNLDKDTVRTHRCHSGRNGATPVESLPGGVIDICNYRWEKLCRGLFQLPVAA